jgi:hypothetical protein
MKGIEQKNDELNVRVQSIETDNGQLKERIRSLETTRTIAIVLATFFGLGGGGYFMLQKLAEVDRQKQQIEAARREAVDKAKDEIDKFASSELLSYIPDSKETDGCARIKDFQICWGKGKAEGYEELKDRFKRRVAFTFRTRFLNTPVIAESIDGSNPGDEGFGFTVITATQHRQIHCQLSCRP